MLRFCACRARLRLCHPPMFMVIWHAYVCCQRHAHLPMSRERGCPPYQICICPHERHVIYSEKLVRGDTRRVCYGLICRMR